MRDDRTEFLGGGIVRFEELLNRSRSLVVAAVTAERPRLHDVVTDARFDIDADLRGVFQQALCVRISAVLCVP